MATYYDEYRPWAIPEETSYYNPIPEPEPEPEIIGECVYCGRAIFDTDREFLINEETETGICEKCLESKCNWRI